MQKETDKKSDESEKSICILKDILLENNSVRKYCTFHGFNH